MSEFRSIRELLEMMLENKELFCYGLCQWANAMWRNGFIQYHEKVTLQEYLEEELPALKYGHLYCWPPCVIEPRIEWIKEHIELNS